jgi:hypothetical protein
MTTYIDDGFESGSFSAAWTVATTEPGYPTISTDVAHTGSYSMKCYMNGGMAGENSYAYQTFATNYGTIYSREYVRFATAMPAASNSSAIMQHQGDYNAISNVRVYNNAGVQTWQLYYLQAATYGTSNYAPASTISLNTWYCVELYSLIHASAGAYKVYIDGTERITISGIDTDNNGSVHSVRYGAIYDTAAFAHTIYTDCVVAANSLIGIEGVAFRQQGFLIQII